MKICYICDGPAAQEYKPKDLVNNPFGITQSYFDLCDNCLNIAKNKKSKQPAIDRTYWIIELKKATKNKIIHCAITGIPLQTLDDSKPDYLSFDHLIPHEHHSRNFKIGETEYRVVKGQPVAQLINDMKSDLSNHKFLDVIKNILGSSEGDQKARKELHSIITDASFSFKRGNFLNTRYCKPCELRFPARTQCPKCGN
ncbi:hypothetical protein [Aneurinibacillus tyrosinisolvens]|uniref:hypothetical protein n=1 Tax=Aneurinibacillus tyrosinisolvens TaxID=1443435 RepID=UPI00063F2312|nr:hypothetical protein [Aneurinibacillus tyrosinisolvens]